MSLQFTVLASGSAGNASLLLADGFGLLLDIGLGPRQLAARLAAVGASWRQVHAVLLTHTHSDHWNDRTLRHLSRLRIPLYCHADHHGSLSTYSSTFAALRTEGLVRPYEANQDLPLAPGLCCRPLRLRHDGGVTCGFRFEGSADFFGQPCALAYAADLGSWGLDLARALGDVDLLALEFNHDVILERNSGRSPYLIARVLGDDGHLSNAQAAALLRAVLEGSAPGRLRQVVQLHLSRECNRPALALAAAREALDGVATGVEVHTAAQDKPSPTFHLGNGANGAGRAPRRMEPRKRSRPARGFQPWLPGMGDEEQAS
jgi:phosphoribosyl 1,2-cyclic phosphodiesterase